jgi:catechol 2,3-dioxygenase-like lactoylglutathione lyase family enzyme
MQIISGIQQIGIGVTNINEAWEWYRKNFGFDVLIANAPGTAELMLPYTGGVPQQRHAILAYNIQGGGGIEVWQYLTRTPEYAKFDVLAGDLGVFVSKIRTREIEKTFADFKEKKLNLLSEIVKDPIGNQHFFVKDPYGNILQVVQDNSKDFINVKLNTGGIWGAIVGVTDIEKSKDFYGKILGYDTVVYQEEGVFSDFAGLPAGNHKFTRVLLSHSQKRVGPFSELLGDSQIELIKVYDREVNKIYKDRFWGDPGFIQICYDITSMFEMKKLCDSHGNSFTVDSNPKSYETKEEIFGMGDAAGHFAYIEDPDGTLIELVETHKIPILKKIGWYLDLTKRNRQKALPKMMLRTLAWGRIKD